MPTLPRCPFPGCPIRYRGGPNRECPEHQNETLAAARELGIDLPGINLLDSYPPRDVDAGQGIPPPPGVSKLENSATTPHAVRAFPGGT